MWLRNSFRIEMTRRLAQILPSTSCSVFFETFLSVEDYFPLCFLSLLCLFSALGTG
jgi:hypothetical protein